MPRMGKIVLTWEAGAYLGHEMLVTSAAVLMQGAGHEVVVYAPDGAAPNDAAKKNDIRWESTPPPPDEAPRAAGVTWTSRATSLWSVGFRSKAILRDRFDAWDVILERERPDAVLLQAAPFAQVAAHVGGYSSVEFGISFDVPPQASPFPPFRQADAFSPVDALQLEVSMLERLALVVPAARHASGLHAMVSGGTRLVTSIAELDHYAGSGDASRRFVGPLPVVELRETHPRWKQPARSPRILAYVRAPLHDSASLLRALAKVRADAVVVCLDADDAIAALAAQLGIRLQREPVSIGELLASADLVISHGGGLIAEALVRGCPCMALPTHYEQFITAQNLKRRRLGVMLNPKEPQVYEAALRFVLQNTEIRRNAAAMKARYRGLGADPGAAFRDAVDNVLDEAGR